MNAVSLRARLLVGMVILVAAGLTAAAFVTYEEQRSFLLDRVDQQVQAALVPISFQLRLSRSGDTDGLRPAAFGGRLRPRPPGLTRAANLPPGTFGELLGPHGTVLERRTFSYGEGTPSTPALPAHPLLSRPGGLLRTFTVQSSASGESYRAAAFAVGSDTVVVAVPLREADDTLHRLVLVELLVGLGVILALVALGWVVIRIGLRPLERIGRVASEIAHGDLSRRVTPADQRTEIGRLAQSLNEMLVQIEQAFSDRAQSEDRLRRFLADASHELRTPLASIRGYAELFRLGAADDPETLERTMTRIEAEATRMGVLVEDLLLLARLDQEPERRREPVDLRSVVQQSVEDIRVIAPDRDIALHAEEPCIVLGDPDQLRQLVGNLMRNAVVHTPAGTPIELELSAGDGRVRFRVRDHGPGLPAAAGEQLFERFWRVESGRRRGRGGSGLGLSIVRAVTIAHGGEVRAANAPDGGASFVVDLPAAGSPHRTQETLSLLTTDSYLHPTH